jgi:membrane protein
MLARLRRFLSDEIWKVRLQDLSAWRSFPLRWLRIFILTVREIVEDRCILRASALTFYSLLSIGPVVALALGIAKGFGLQKRLEEEVLSKIPAQEEVLIQIKQYALVLLENTRGGVIAGVGVVLLLWSALKVLHHLEGAFNDIWHVATPRAWRQKISNYLTFLLLAPLFLLIYSSIPGFVTAQFSELSNRVALLNKFGPLILSLLHLLPYLLPWLLFTLVYIVIPNTRVSPASGITAGITAGTLYQLVQWGMVEFQVGVAKYNPVYGSLVALPLLLMWMYVGWVILLSGAEFAYAHQNIDQYAFGPDPDYLSPDAKRVLALQLTHFLVKAFTAGKGPLDAGRLAEQLDAPISRVRRTLADLVAAGLVSSLGPCEDTDPVYQPASDVHRWTIMSVIDALEGRSPNSHRETDGENAITHALRELETVMTESQANRRLIDL